MQCAQGEFWVLDPGTKMCPLMLEPIIPVVVHYLDDFVVPRDDILMFQTVNEDCGFYHMSFIYFDFNIDQYLFLYSSPTSL